MSNLKLLSSECNNADDGLRDIEIRSMQLEEEKLQFLQRKKTLNELKTQVICKTARKTYLTLILSLL